VIGVDAHQRTHTLVLADELGRELASKTLAATADGHLSAIRRGRELRARKGVEPLVYQFTGRSSGPTMWLTCGPSGAWVKCPPYQTTTSWSTIGSGGVRYLSI